MSPEGYGIQDAKDSLANISKAKNLLEYDPLFSAKEGMEVTWEVFCK